MIGLIIFLCIAAVVLLIGMIGDKEAANRRNYTYAFCMCLFTIIAIVLSSR